jgi:aminoglycoside phosphotransferase family enzyme
MPAVALHQGSPAAACSNPRMEFVETLPDTEAKLRYLESTLATATAGEPVRRLETHMSWLLIGAERVLKLKKPVRYPFLDFSTLRSREHNAREELRLNRRLAPRAYLGVFALRCEDGVFSLQPDDRPEGGRIVDWVVAMQRLPTARMLDQVIARGALLPGDIDALVGLLVPFYRRAAHAAVGEDACLELLRSEQATNRSVLGLSHFDLPQVECTLDRMDRCIDAQERALRRRVRDGRIVEAHGDLRPEHVCLVEPPVVIDALEFDSRLRELDPFDELCFLGLECAMVGNAALGPELARRCADALDDHPPAALLSLYTARRALLRARLSAAHLLEANVHTPAKWLPQTGRYLQHARDALDTLESARSGSGA